MFAAERPLIEAVKQWVEIAEGDLWLSSLALKHAGIGHPPDGACFHAQQCAEKYLKALLTWQQISFPRTHDIEELLARLPERQRPELSADEQRTLTRYATVIRYLGDYEPITLTEARRAVTLARRRLPKQALLA